MKFLVIAVVLSIMNAGVYGADPDPLTDFTTRVKTLTLRNIFSNGDVTVDSGGVRPATSVAKFPAAA
ncbi:hypothetical protein SUGI_0716870 [Cryptomeria japonica]|nr:hypothetical protein SUGI_0716870 [Cryptomeria japonica]